MGFRCELCDSWLPMLSFSKLCPTCYKLRTIVKCYNAEDILKNAEEHFLVSHAREEEEIKKDKEFFIKEEARIQKDFEEELKQLTQQKEVHLATIVEEEEQAKDLKELKKNKSESSLEDKVVDLGYSTKTRNGNKKKQLKSP
tara:strand:- start:268 stop:693 length:426 start_codon:yes stop_codon:yes gene_type:complete